MKNHKVTTYAKNKRQTALLKHQPRDWKFWLLVVLTVAWCVLFFIAVINNSNTYSMPRWWADHIKSDEDTTNVKVLPREFERNPAQLPYSKVRDYYQLSFDILSSFPADTPVFNNPRKDSQDKDGTLKNQVPHSIEVLDGEKISIAGFMIPMIMEKDRVSSFILAQTRGSCCYGQVPKFNQWIYVEMMQGKTTGYLMDIPITVFGTLSVNEKWNSQNNDWYLYRMDGEQVDLPRPSWFGFLKGNNNANQSFP